FPLWGEDTSKLGQRFIDDGFRAMLCCVDTQQLDAKFCGREFDAALLSELPASCDSCGENGEFHTCVYAGPMWNEPLHLQRGDHLLRDDRFEFVDLKLL
ncbi:MAG: ATP-binding protein, partial [Rudaea sp.]